MLDAATQVRLVTLLRRESLSVLQYAGEAYPWSSAADLEAVEEIRRMWAEDREALGDLTRALYAARVRPPYIGAFPTGFTTLNFIGLDFLLAKLVADQKRAVADLEADLTAISDPHVRLPVERLLALKKKHLPILEQLASRRKQPAA